MLRTLSVLCRPIISGALKVQVRRTSSMGVSKREFLDHFSRLKVGTIFSPKEMNHILGLLPTMLQKALVNNAREILVTDTTFSGTNGDQTVYERVTPKSFEAQLDLLISRDAILRAAILKKSSEDAEGVRYCFNLD